MTRVRALAHVKARTGKSLHSVGLHGAEVGGIPAQGMTKLRASARCALGTRAGLRRSAPLELMAHGGPPSESGTNLTKISITNYEQGSVQTCAIPTSCYSQSEPPKSVAGELH
eukprot:3763346-Amphidinium_carterae.1